MMPSTAPMVKTRMRAATVISLQLRGQQFSGTPAKWGLQAPIPLVYSQVSSCSAEKSFSSGVYFWLLMLWFDGDLNKLFSPTNGIQLFMPILPNITTIKPITQSPTHTTISQPNPSNQTQFMPSPLQLPIDNKQCMYRTIKQQYIHQMQKQSHNGNTQPTHPHHHHHHAHQHEAGDDYNNQQEGQYEEEGRESQAAHWKVKEQRKRYRKQIFGEHYNYNYRKPNQHKMYRIQENRNTEIQRSNRILLEKIQTIFKRSMGRKRIKQINTSQAASISQMTNKTSQMAVQSQPHSTSNIKSKKISLQQELEMKILNGGGQRKSMKQGINKIGQISKNIAMAKNQVNKDHHYSHTHDIGNSKQTYPNRKHVKLEQLQEQVISKRKRIQTEISRPVKKNSQLNQQQQEQGDNLYNPSPNNKKTSRKTITSNSQNSPNPNPKQITHQHHPHHQQPPIKQTHRSSTSTSKIILHKSTITLNNQPYRIQLYVDNSTYVISSYCTKNGREYHELITMPYKHYQELYKCRLNQSHQAIYQYLFVEPVKGLLQISGFDSKFMDIFEYGEIQLNQHEPSPVSKQKAKQKQKDSRASEEVSGAIIHFNNNNMNGDDTFDRITYVNSQIKNEGLRDVNSTPGPLTEQFSPKIENTNEATRRNTTNKKQAIIMTDPILPQLGPELIESRIQPMKNSQGQSRLKRKEQKLSSNLINLQIEPVAGPLPNQVLQTKNLQRPQNKSPQPAPNSQNESIDVSEIEKQNKSQANKISRQNRVYQPYSQEQYQNIEVIQDN